MPGLLRRLLALVSGTLAGNVIVLLATPILTRLYEPALFGELALFVSFSGVLGAVLCLRYEQAVYLPSSDRNASLLTAGAGGIALALTVISTGVAAGIVLLSGGGALGYWWLAVPLAGGALALFNLGSNWAVREHHVAVVARSRISRALVQVLVQLAAGTSGAMGGGLVLGDLAGRFAGLPALIRLYSARLSGCRPSFKRVMSVLRRYHRFPLISAPGALVNVVVMQGAPVILALFYSTTAAGLYFLVQRLMAAPLALVGQSVAQVFTAELGRRLGRNEGGYLGLYLKASGCLLLVGGIPIALVGIYGGNLLPSLLGPEWSQAGDYLLALTPFFVGQFVMSPLANFLNVLGRQGTLLLWDSARLVIALPGLILPGMFGWSVVQALWVFSLLMAVFYVVLFVVLYVEIWRRSHR